MNSKMMRRFSAWIMTVIMSLTLIAVPVSAAETHEVILSSRELTLKVGDPQQQLSATVTGVFTSQNAHEGLEWMSSNPAVATVTRDGGRVEAVGYGTATITATYTDGTKSGSASCQVTVVKPITGLFLDTLTEPLAIGKSAELKATIEPEDATEALKWSVVGDADVVSLSVNGNTCTVTAEKPGDVIVKAAAEDGEPAAESRVIVSGIVLDATSLELLRGDTKTLAVRSYGNAPAESSVVWSSTNISVAEVIDGRVTGHYSGTATIKAEAGSYQATCTVTVEEDLAEVISISSEAGTALPFSELVSALNNRSQDKTESALNCISSLQVSPSQGSLYYGYVATDNPGTGVGSENYYVNPDNGQLELEKIVFVAKPGFSGTAIISYSGRGTNDRNFSGMIHVSVSAAEDVCYSTSADQPVYFKAADFSSACIAKTGKDIISISFVQPSSRAGTLYYNYKAANVYNPEVSSGVTIYRTKAPYLDDVVFVPNPDYSGSVDITYYCTTSAGTHTGQVSVEVAGVKELDDRRITYDVAPGGYVDLDADDFHEMCRDLTDSGLSYVYFDLPNTAEGTLYYDYISDYTYGSPVSGTTRYFRNSNPGISGITFVASGGYSGDVSVPFMGYSTGGDSFSGEVVFRVGGHDGVISYYSNYGEEIYFDDAEFNELCRSLNGRSLSYVYFEQPASGRGTLYRSATYSSRTRLSSTTKFYRSGGSYQIDDVVFVPDSSYAGTVDIPFRGYDVWGERISGVVRINVKQQAGSLATGYQATVGYIGSSVPVRLRTADFENAYRAVTGRTLTHIRFTDLPKATEGRFYLNYNSPIRTGTAVKVHTNYYVGKDPSVGQITFVPRAGYQGAVTISFVAVDASGFSITGSLRIDISNWYLPNHFTDMTAYGAARPSVEFLHHMGVANGYGDGTYGPAKSISRGEFTAMVYRAFELPDAKNINSFPDVATNSYYAKAVASAKELGIVQGYGKEFKPQNSITRQDAMTIVLRAMKATGRTVPSVSTSMLSSYADGSQVAAHAGIPVSTMLSLGAVDVNAARQIRPYAPLTRAEMAVLLHHILTQ